LLETIEPEEGVMNIFSCFMDGIRRVNSAKRYIFVVYLINVLLALGLAISLGGAIKDSLGSSMAAERLRDGFDGFWYSNFSAQARDLAATFDPSVVGIGAIFNSLDAFLQGNVLDLETSIVAIGIFYLLLWSFFSAAFISIYIHRDDTSGPHSFFNQGAHFFWRFLQLAIMAGIIYYLLFHFVMPWLTDRVTDLTRQMVDERVVFSYVLIKYLILWSLVLGVNIIFDYSKIITVWQDRSFVLTIPWQALRFIGSHLVSTTGLYLCLGVVGIVLMLFYWLIVPGAGQASWVAITGVFLIGQLYILSRIWMRCLFYAGQATFYESVAGQLDSEPDTAEAAIIPDKVEGGGEMQAEQTPQRDLSDTT
jgi:hypothetical protein